MRLSDQQKIDIVKQYENGFNSTQIAKLYHVSPGAILGLLHRRNVKVRTNDKFHRKYNCDIGIFDAIDCEEKAYWLGFLLGDGTVTHAGSLSLELSRKDINHVIKFKAFMKNTSPLRYTTKNCIYGGVNSKELCARIAKYGLIPNKTISVVTPNIKKDLLSHFYRGILESDGWICKHSMRYGSRDQHEFGFSSANLEFLKEIKEWLEESLQKKCGHLIKRSKNQSCCQLIVGGNQNFIKLYELFYEGSNVYLTRKHDIATSFYKEVK